MVYGAYLPLTVRLARYDWILIKLLLAVVIVVRVIVGIAGCAPAPLTVATLRCK